MELVEGIDFLSHVRFDPDQPLAPTAATGLLASRIMRLRESLRQLAEGVTAMHEAGRAHCDLKPSNVLVTGTGRVVILDFGLATDLGPEGTLRLGGTHLMGTLAYMAPEQAAGLPVSPAADWYSVGVMLYEALTGQLPFLGRPMEVLKDKQRFEPPAPRILDVHVPEDLDSLCVDLLRRAPEARPTGAEVRDRLGGPAFGSGSCGTDDHRPLSRRFPWLAGSVISRDWRPLSRTCGGGAPWSSTCTGGRGAGKTAARAYFLNTLMERHEAVVLSGRCYEREDVPFKAFDSLVDALGRYLEGLSRSEAQPLLPRDLRPLAQVFPVLRHIAAVAAVPQCAKIPDPQELRRRAFAALRALLASLGGRKPLVLFIDDLQWGDLDSAAAPDRTSSGRPTPLSFSCWDVIETRMRRRARACARSDRRNWGRTQHSTAASWRLMLFPGRRQRAWRCRCSAEGG